MLRFLEAHGPRTADGRREERPQVLIQETTLEASWSATTIPELDSWKGIWN